MEGGHCAPASTRRAPTPPTAPTLPRGRPPLTRAERLGGGGRGPRGAGRADLLTSVCLAAGLRRGRRQRLAWNQMCRGAALAATGAARSHARAGAHMARRGGRRLARRAGHPRGSGADPRPAGVEKRPPPPTSQRRQCPASMGKWPRHAGLPRVGSPEGRIPLGKPSPSTPPTRAGDSSSLAPEFVFLSLCVRFFKVLSQSFP